MNRNIKKIIELLKKHYGNVKPGLEYENVYQLSIAVILSAQTTDRQVNKVTPALFEKYPGLKQLSAAKIKDVEKLISSTGFYHNKAKHIVSFSKKVMEEFSGNIPDSMEDLLKLPGIGRKSASVILSQGFGKPGFAVDTHVIRLSNRMGFTASKDPMKIEKDVTSMLEENLWFQAHLLLVHHGRNLCFARNPLCGECPVSSLCTWTDKNF